MGVEGAHEKELCSDYYDTANSNIELFLKDKTQKRKIWIENIINDFKNFWMAINAKGNYLHAISKLANKYN